MSPPKPLETRLLQEAEGLLNEYVKSEASQGFELRLQILEAASSRLGGFEFEKYRKTFSIQNICSIDMLQYASERLVRELDKTPIHPALALSALSREPLNTSNRRKTGAYHTDFRLAKRLSELPKSDLIEYEEGFRVIDPACGAGILLVGLTLEFCGHDRIKTANWLRNCVCAVDLSPLSLRASRLSLASMTDDLDAIQAMWGRFKVADSLLASELMWSELAPMGFDVIIANPPWEKVKLTKHEHQRENGSERHYGAEFKDFDDATYQQKRGQVLCYAGELIERFPNLSSGELDLYMAFMDLYLQKTKPGGMISVLVPGGLIRSEGTSSLRQSLNQDCENLTISVFDNKSNFFEIDTRFKFLAVFGKKKSSARKKRRPILLKHERGTLNATEVVGSAHLGRMQLSRTRSDFSLPEVRNDKEWALFTRLSVSGISWENEQWGWRVKFCREVDMTRDKPAFCRADRDGDFYPIVEGRMVQQYRFGAKGYVSGTGRRAVWERYAPGNSQIASQFFISAERLPNEAHRRASRLRAGFCDIVGQTNERTFMSTLIPAGVVCGNKVPTVEFLDDPSEERLLAWVAVTNSFAFDWMLRRVVTTTVNYFLLLSVPLPRIVRDGLPWRQLVAAAAELTRLDNNGSDESSLWRIAELRAEIDAEVAVAYGLDISDLEMILADFPLLDRGQPALSGETSSTITKDFLLTVASRRLGIGATVWEGRVNGARKEGATPYLSSEYAETTGSVKGGGKRGGRQR